MSHHPKPAALVLLLLLAASLCACTAASKPLLTKINKRAASVYTAPLLAGRPLVLDLSAPAVTTPCSSGSTTTTVTLSGSSTNGANPLSPVSFAATASCAAAPSGAAGVAGLGRSGTSFPAQVASTQKVANSVALCLPSDTTGPGAAIFGGGPFYLAPPADRPAITTLLSNPVPLHQPVAGSPAGYFVTAPTGIAVDGTTAVAGPLVVGLSTTVPYTQLRADVYHALVTAFDRALGLEYMGQRIVRVSAVSPFHLCYNSSFLFQSRLVYQVPTVDVMLEGGTNFTVDGGNSMAQVNSDTACFPFLQMPAKAAAGSSTTAPAAVIIGGFQMEDHLVVLDNAKNQLSFTGYVPFMGFSCSNFNFTTRA